MPPNSAGAVRTSLAYEARNLPYSTVVGATFSPGTPVQPVAEEPVRGWDFPVGYNTTYSPRYPEPFTFPMLRAFANVEPVRLAIETRKDQLERQEWQIKPLDEPANRNNTEMQARCAKMEKFFRRPDGVTPFSTWLRIAAEDLLAIDAPAFELRRNRGGELIGIEPIPGDTIKVLVDDTGRIPLPPYAAYQQIIKGRIWANLSTSDLLYSPRNKRPNHLLGFSPVEQIIVTINTVIGRQSMQLAYFTEGNTPPGLLNAPAGWTLGQIREVQTWIDAQLSGLPAERKKLLWVPADTKYSAIKDAPLKDDFDEWLYRIVAFCFSLPPTPFIKQMNRSTAGADQDRSEEEGLEPLKLWVKRLIDGIIQDADYGFGQDDIEFSFVDTPSIDPQIQARIDDINIGNGSMTRDEARDARGQDPLPDGLGEAPTIKGGVAGVTLLDAIINPPEPQPPPDLVSPGSGAAPGGEPAPGAPAAGGPPGAANAKPAGAAVKFGKASKLITAERPKARRATVAIRKAIAPILTKVGDEVAHDVAMKLRGMHKALAGAHQALAEGESVVWGKTEDVNAALAVRLANLAALRGLDGISDAIFDDLFDITQDSAELALATVGVKVEGDLVNQVHDRAVAWAQDRAAQLVSLQGTDNIVGSTRAMLRDIISTGLNNNIGANAIADSIQNATAFSEERADLIARTEISMANGAGKMIGWEQSGLPLQKYWEAEEDCCDDCAANQDASPIGLDETFPSGDDSEPGHPNCRCSTYAEVTGE